MAKKIYNSMNDFAAVCGISRPTLSKYFNDPTTVKEVTRKRIEAALKKSNFEPNMFARHLNRKRTRNIGILVPTMSDPFYVQVVTLIELELRAKGYWPIQISCHTRPELEEEAIRTLLAFKVAGAIVAPLGAQSQPSALPRLTDAIPVVCFDTPASIDLPYVGNDNVQSVAAMVQYLCRSGEPPVFLEVPRVNENSGERQNSYRATMLKEGHSPLVIDCEASGSWEFERLGFEQMQRLLAKGGLPGKTVLCANDRFAFGAMAAACQAGMKIGRSPNCDIRIAGHDDHPLSRYTCPSLTTMAQNAPEIAAKSVEILLRRIDEADEGKMSPARSLTLEATLMMRDSA